MPPSLFDQLLESLEALTDILARRDTRALVGHLFDASDWTVSQPKQPEAQVRAQVPIEASPATCRFAFLIHLLDENDIGQLDPGLATLKPEALARVRPLIASELKPAVLSAFPVTAPNGRVAHGELILVPRSAQELLAMPRALAAASVLEAALLASRRGAQVIGLGGFCSVVTDGGKAIFAGVPGALTTGNALTAASAARAVIAVLEQQARSPARTTAMVIGALGSIGRAVATLLAGYVSRLILVGRRERPDIAQARLNALVGDVIDDLLHNDMERRPGSITERVRREPQEFRRIHFHLTTDPTPVWSEADVVVTSTSAVGLLVDPNALARGAIVCDVSRPINVPRVVIQQRPDVTFIEGGVMVPPPPFDTGVDLGIGRDRTYACLAETMIVALESATNRCTVGQHIDLAKMRWFEAASERAGFSVAGPFANAYSR
jgi:predicted amino acid dehydrogenase